MELFSITKEPDLNRFISDNIQPTAEYLDRCGQVVDRLVKFLQNSVSDTLRPRRVIKVMFIGVQFTVKRILNDYFQVPLQNVILIDQRNMNYVNSCSLAHSAASDTCMCTLSLKAA